jgi:tetratricopeptide (TPR) repeat protein
MREKRNTSWRSWIAAAALVLGVAGFGLSSAAGQTAPKQSSQPQSGQQATPTGQGQPAGTGQAASTGQAAPTHPPVTKEEEDAYKAFAALTPAESAQIVSVGEKFLSERPASPYRPAVFAKLVFTYSSLGQMDKVFATSDKALTENPDNIDVLSLICTLLPVANFDPRSLDAEQKLATAEKYAKHVLELAPTISRPSDMTEEQFSSFMKSKLGMAHSGLGRVYFREGRTADLVREFDQSTKTDPTPDPLDYYLLGQGQLRLKDYPDAAAAFDQCAKAKWSPQWQERCKDGVKQAKEAASAPVKP